MAELKISRGMDREKLIAAARELGCTVNPPSGGNNHWRLEHPAHPGRHLNLSVGRRDTPWVAFQWIRRVKEHVDRLQAAERARPAAIANSIPKAVPAAPEVEPAPSPEDLLEELRMARLMIVEAQTRRRKAEADLHVAHQMGEEAKAAAKLADDDLGEAEEEYRRLLAELDSCVASEAAA